MDAAADLKQKLLSEFSDVFKEDLDKDDVMDGVMHAELNDKIIDPTHIRTPAPIPVHLRQEADK